MRSQPVISIAFDGGRGLGIRRAARAGFTLLEMVVVVLILGVLWTIALPKFADATHVQRARAAAFRIAADLNLARHHAKTTSTDQTVRFDSSQHEYELSGLSHPDRPGNAYLVHVDEGAFPVQLNTVSFASHQSTTSTVSFDLYGRPFCSGQPLISGYVIVQSANAYAGVVINRLTGKAEVR